MRLVVAFAACWFSLVLVSALLFSEAQSSTSLARPKNDALDEEYVIRGNDMLFRSSLVNQGVEVFQHRFPNVSSSLLGKYDKGEASQRRLRLHRELQQRASRLLSSSLECRRSMFWSLWEMFDRYKTEASMWDTSAATRNGRPTLRKFHYIILPVWWDGQPRNAGTTMQKSQIARVMARVRSQYRRMSWNRHDLTYEVWDQVVLRGVTQNNANFENSESAARRLIVARRGKVEFVDFTGIMLVYYTANAGPFEGGGGWANVNGNFLWSSYETSYDVLRHEIGHNYGHPHHLSNRYAWRIHDGAEIGEYYDGWDMMSGGNHYLKSDFAVASKWFFNWVTNNAVVMMQPEGPTDACPSCRASVQRLVLKAFDDVNVKPSAANKMAVHIPILGTAEDQKAYSYWLSYRGTGNDGLAAGGVSVHVSWFGLGGIFGASYDSLNYDAFGGTSDTTFDSFVVPGTCYVVAPSLLLMGVSYGAVEQVQPIVCVDRLRRAKDVTISVSFLDPSSPPKDNLVLESKRTMTCKRNGASSGNLKLDASEGKDHLLHYTGTGMGGTIDVSMCLESADPSIVTTAYFYDTYPFSVMALDSPPGYGAYRSLRIESSADCSNAKRPPAASAWRFWVAPEFTDRGWLWDVTSIRLYSSWTCSPDSIVDTSSGTPIDSGNAGPGWGPSNAFGGSDGTWGGRADSKGNFWIGMQFSSNVAVGCAIVEQSEGRRLRVQAKQKSGSSSRWVNVWEERNLRLGNNVIDMCEDCGKHYTMQYESEYGEAYVLIKSTTTRRAAQGTTASLAFSSTCKVTECHGSQYMARGGTCQQCPEGSVSSVGSTSIDDCVSCSAAGLVAGHPKSTECYPATCGAGDVDPSITTAPAWRLWTPAINTAEGWAWDVVQIEFYSSADCSASSLVDTSSGTAIDSGNAGPGWGPSNAFGAGTWGGRTDEFGAFWIGMDFAGAARDVTVRCIVLEQPVGHFATNLYVQARVNGGWNNVWEATNLGVGENRFPNNSAPSPKLCQNCKRLFRRLEQRSSGSSGRTDCTNRCRRLPNENAMLFIPNHSRYCDGLCTALANNSTANRACLRRTPFCGRP